MLGVRRYIPGDGEEVRASRRAVLKEGTTRSPRAGCFGYGVDDEISPHCACPYPVGGTDGPSERSKSRRLPSNVRLRLRHGAMIPTQAASARARKRAREISRPAVKSCRPHMGSRATGPNREAPTDEGPSHSA